MNLEERSQLKEDIAFLKSASDAIAANKKDAQHIRGALNRVVKAGTDYDWYTKQYDKLLGNYIANDVALKELAKILNMEIRTLSKPGSEEPVQYTLVLTVNGETKEVALTEEQYITLEKLCFLKHPECFIRNPESIKNDKDVSK